MNPVEVVDIMFGSLEFTILAAHCDHSRHNLKLGQFFTFIYLPWDMDQYFEMVKNLEVNTDFSLKI